jgi:hypothetical protein
MDGPVPNAAACLALVKAVDSFTFIQSENFGTAIILI